MKNSWLIKNMTGRQKILQVLEHIKHESEINPDPEWIEFNFSMSNFPGMLNADQEVRILTKLENEEVLKICLPKEGTMEGLSVPIKILPAFYPKYYLYRLTSFDENNWNLFNPFWLAWKFILGVSLVVEWLWRKNKLITIAFSTLGGLLVYDWTLAWKNFKVILVYLKIP